MLYEKRGCQVVVALAMGLVAIGFIAPSMCNNNAMNAANQQGGTIVKVNGRGVTESELTALETRMNQQMPASNDPRQRVQRLAMLTNQLVQQAALQSIADREKVQPTEQMVREGITSEIETQLMMAKLQMQMNGQLKQDSTDAEFEEAFKKLSGGSTTAEYKKRMIDELDASFKDPARKQEMLSGFIGQALTDHYAKKFPATEADFKKSTEVLVLNRLAISNDNLSEDQRNAKAEEARKELESGKPFAEVYKKFVGSTAPAPTEMAVSSLESQENMKPLLDLQPKGVSGVISEFGTPAVFQLESRKEVLPPDYEKNKQKELENFSKVQASKKLDEEIKAITKDSSKIQWEIPAFKLFYAYAQALNESTTKPEVFKTISEEAATMQADPKISNGSDLTLLEYVAFEDAYQRASASEQIGLKEKREQVMSAALNVQDSPQLRAQLAELQHDLKKNDDAAGSLSKAISDTIAYDAEAESFVKAQEQKALAWEKDKSFDATQAQLVKDAAKTWREGKVQWDKDQAELKKMEEEAKKQQAADQAKLEAEAKKQAEELEKQNTTGSTAPATTGTNKPSGQ